MSANSPILIETYTVTAESLGATLEALKGCWKSSSLLWMQTNAFPVLSGLILNGWTEESERLVAKFCRERQASELLLRIEQPGQRWTRRRGGYLIQSKQARDLAQELNVQGFLTILLEPLSPYSDSYSLTAACDLGSGKTDVEVVGHGFDASDILRSDLLPHERFEILLPHVSPQLQEPRIERTSIIDRDRYLVTVRKRLEKIGAKLRNPAFPDEVLASKTRQTDLQELASDATQFLRSSGQLALLEHSNKYEPIPQANLESFVHEFSRLVRRIQLSGLTWMTLSAAASVVPTNRLIFWDFFVPGEQNTLALTKV